jgi:predicted DNA repair protein MutK
MPATSLLALIDDIAGILDDVATMTKVAATKTAGVLGDDLALNAQQVSGVRAERELPVVWAVAKGSLVNKAILVPAALAISTVAPWAVTPLLMAGGAYLCHEGVEKLAHQFLPGDGGRATQHREPVDALAQPGVDIVTFERAKVKGAIRTDFILSAEIITISLGSVAEAAFVTQLLVLSGIGVIMTFGVYGLVAGIVKLDDAGLYLSRITGEGGRAKRLRAFGRGLLASAPILMKILSVVGTAAMFLVGGGILVHGIPSLHHGILQWSAGLAAIPAIGTTLASILPMLLDGLVGIAAGGLTLSAVTVGSRGGQKLRDMVRIKPR